MLRIFLLMKQYLNEQHTFFFLNQGLIEMRYFENDFVRADYFFFVFFNPLSFYQIHLDEFFTHFSNELILSFVVLMNQFIAFLSYLCKF